MELFWLAVLDSLSGVAIFPRFSITVGLGLFSFSSLAGLSATGDPAVDLGGGIRSNSSSLALAFTVGFSWRRLIIVSMDLWAYWESDAPAVFRSLLTTGRTGTPVVSLTLGFDWYGPGMGRVTVSGVRRDLQLAGRTRRRKLWVQFDLERMFWVAEGRLWTRVRSNCWPIRLLNCACVIPDLGGTVADWKDGSDFFGPLRVRQ